MEMKYYEKDLLQNNSDLLNDIYTSIPRRILTGFGFTRYDHYTSVMYSALQRMLTNELNYYNY